MLTRPLTQPLTGPLVRGVGEGGGLSLPQIGTMVAVACGNSIAAQSKFQTDHWNWNAEIHAANVLSGSPLRFKPITASTRCDQYGVYGYSGARLDTINADIQAQWITPINTASVTPNLVVGLALLENDLAQGAIVSDMTSRLTAWLSAVQTAWPSAKVLICTPRPASNYNTPQLVSNYQAMRDYTLSLANNRTIFTARLDGYENPANPGTPLSGYTSDGLHPNTKGGLVNARVIAATLRRIGIVTATDTITSNNRTLSGSVAASGTGVSGFKPTSATLNAVTGGTTASEALNPGWRMTIAGSSVNFSVFSATPAVAVSGAPAYVSAYTVIRLGAGAENLRSIEIAPRLLDTGGNTFHYYLTIHSGEADLDLLPGDVLTFVAPPAPPNSGPITQVTNYITAAMKATAASATFDVIDHGWMTVP